MLSLPNLKDGVSRANILMKKLVSNAPSELAQAINSSAHALFIKMLKEKMTTSCLTFSAIAAQIKEEGGGDSTGLTLVQCAKDFASVAVVFEVVDEGHVSEMVYPLFDMSKINEVSKTLCVRLNAALLTLVLENPDVPDVLTIH